jgi:hypothetical protein
MESKLLTVYKDLCATAHIHVNDDGSLSLQSAGKDGAIKLLPFTIKGQRVVLPTKERLQKGIGEDAIGFHPLAENIGRGESPILERFRMLLNERLNIVTAAVVTRLLQIALSPDDQKKLNPEQSEYLPLVKKVSPLTLERFKDIVDKMPAGKSTQQFVSVFLRRKATLGGESYFRAGIATFPFFALLNSGEESPHGVKLSKKDVEVLQNLLNYIFPHLGDENYYSRGSSARLGPSTDAIMKTVLALAAALNDVSDLFEDFMPAGVHIPTEWAEEFENIEALSPWVREIPMLSGNEGSHDGAAPAQAQTQPVGTPSAPQQQQRSIPQATVTPNLIGGAGQRQSQPARQGSMNYADYLRDRQNGNFQQQQPMMNPGGMGNMGGGMWGGNMGGYSTPI